MNYDVPEILWYLLWAFVLTVLPLLMIVADYRRRMKALEILRIYAEKGVEPPSPVADLLSNEATAPKAANEAASPRDARIGGFIGFSFMACALGAGAWWMWDSGGPKIIAYPLTGFAMFFGVGAIGYLLVAMFTRDK